jgi:hypothetical protein
MARHRRVGGSLIDPPLGFNHRPPSLVAQSPPPPLRISPIRSCVGSTGRFWNLRLNDGRENHKSLKEFGSRDSPLL